MNLMRGVCLGELLGGVWVGGFGKRAVVGCINKRVWPI